MAFLQTIRTKASWLLIGAIGLALLAFILTDLFSSGNAFINKFKDKAFTVDGETVTTGDYNSQVEMWEMFQKMRSGEGSLDENVRSQIREVVYNQMAREIMLKDQAEKLGLTVTSEELNDMVYGKNVSPILASLPFFINPQTNQFDRAVLSQFLAEISQDVSGLSLEDKARVDQEKQIWNFIENMLIYQRLEEKYTTLLASTILISDTEAKSSYENSKYTSNIAYVLDRYSSIPDSAVQVDKKEIEALYNLRKNNYKLDDQRRKISYIIKDVVPSEEDYAEAKQQADSAYSKLISSQDPSLVVSEYSTTPYLDGYNSLSDMYLNFLQVPSDAKEFIQTASVGQVYGPMEDNQSYIMCKIVGKTVASDSIQLQMIPLQGLSPAVANNIADSLLNVIKGGKDFALVAEEIAPGSRGGEIGWVNELMLQGIGSDIVEQCFTASKGQVLKVNINGQPQIMRVADKTAPVNKYKLAVVKIPVDISDKTLSRIDNELNQFISESGNLENFDNGALSKGYNISSNEIISPSALMLKQTPNTRPIIHWAFNEKVGQVKKFDLSTNAKAIAIVKENIESEYLPMTEVESDLKAELIKDKKAEKIIADLKAKNLSSLDAYAQNLQSKVDTANFVTFQTPAISTLGYEPILNAYAEAGQVDKLNGPVKGQAGVFILKVLEKTENKEQYNQEQTKNQLRQNIYPQLIYQSMNTLWDKMNVKDNRIKFF